VLPGFLKIDGKLIELVRKCEELYDMSNKKYSDCLERKTVGTNRPRVEKIRKVPMFYCAF
jgi:hypothetical protein